MAGDAGEAGRASRPSQQPGGADPTTTPQNDAPSRSEGVNSVRPTAPSSASRPRIRSSWSRIRGRAQARSLTGLARAETLACAAGVLRSVAAPRPRSPSRRTRPSISTGVCGSGSRPLGPEVTLQAERDNLAGFPAVTSEGKARRLSRSSGGLRVAPGPLERRQALAQVDSPQASAASAPHGRGQCP